MKSIRKEILRRVLAGSALLLAAAGVLLAATIHRQLVREFDYTLETKVKALATLTVREGDNLEIDFAPERPPVFTRGEDPECFQFRWPDGAPLLRSESLGEDELPMPESRRPLSFATVRLPHGARGRLAHLVFSPRVEKQYEDEVREEDEEDEILVPIPEAVNTDALSIVVTVGRDRARLDRLLASLYLALSLGAGLLLGGIALLVRRSLRKGFAPVDALNRQIRRLEPDSLEERITLPDPPEELGAILTTLNGLLERLESAFLRQRRFSSDVAHELRTPVSELCAACEVGEMYADDPAEVRTFLQDIRAVATQMGRIVTNLLELSRCQNRVGTVTPEMVAIEPLLVDCWRRVPPDMLGEDLQFESRVDPQTRVETDRAKLQMILQNVIDNAATYSEPGTAVVCRGDRRDDGFTLSIENRSRHTAPEDLKHVFEPFWRKDPARTEGRHAGLGLPLAKALAELLGIQMAVDMKDGIAFRLRLVFPRAALQTG